MNKSLSDSIPKDLGQWAVDQMSKPEILKRELLREYAKNIMVENRLKSLVELLNQCNLEKYIPSVQTPLNPFICVNAEKPEMEEIKPNMNGRFILRKPEKHTVIEWHSNSWFSKKSVSLESIVREEGTIYELTYSKSGLFGETAVAVFHNYDLAMESFRDVVKAMR